MNTPFELLWGVDVAIKKLRPGANFSLNNNTFVFWEDPTGRPAPTWTEVQEQLEKERILNLKSISEFHSKSKSIKKTIRFIKSEHKKGKNSIYNTSEDELNSFGYELLYSKKENDALMIQVEKLEKIN